MPLDDGLPIFHLVPQAREPHITTLTFTVNGSPPTTTYTKTRAPDIDATYSTTLHDAFVPDILYATVTATPEIIQQQASSPGALPPPAKVLLPKEFPLQLYNPDSTVIVTHNHSTLRGNFWEFSLPKTSFLPPTASRLDAASAAHRNALAHLPRATFRWRKEGGVLSKSLLRCSLVSPANLGNGTRKAGANEPDIPIATFEGLGDKKGTGDITIYQSNLKRVEVEDLKGLEVVLVLSAMAIGDMWFCPTNLMFNLTPTSTPSPMTAGVVASANGGRRRTSSTPSIPPSVTVTPTTEHPPHPTYPQSRRTSYPQHTPSPQQDHKSPRSSPTTAQRDYQTRKAEEAARRAAQLRQEEEATLRMLAEEDVRERQRREMEVERETQRLKMVYERERAAAMQQQQRPPVVGGWGGGRPPVVGGGGGLRPIQEGKKVSSRKSFLGLRFGGGGGGGGGGDAGAGADGVKRGKTKGGKLSKKGSSMF